MMFLVIEKKERLIKSMSSNGSNSFVDFRSLRRRLENLYRDRLLN